MHRREDGCAIILKGEKSYTTAASNLAGNARQQQLPPTRPAMPASTHRLRSFKGCSINDL